MNDKIKELKKAIENNLIKYTSLIADENEVILLQRFAKETVLLKIKADEKGFSVIENYYYEEDVSNIEENSKFNSLEELLDFIC